ncbi:hypothetical protein [Aquimarina sp. 2201CG5-10]|uniref:hypothetical protein n=1 Tax=Aquimarina callyspongiae TaxID=3098150 RepID=UPI002AB4655D|nr:hypothetical protein [Aquimarina sp. 2201CG5-10]MDY8134689.1 hypothetical protein [Aquimarina sp. 2201CG5-10]
MKKTKNNYTEVGAVVGGIFGLILNIVHQSEKKEENPEIKFDFQSLIITGILGAIVGAASFRIIGFLLLVFNSKEEILNENDEIKYLASVLETYEPDDIDREVLLKGKRIRAAINKRFSFDLLGKATYQGSKVVGTALSGLSDLDILVKFKKTSFCREKDMYYELFKFLKYHFNDPDLLDVRQQKVSIGLIFNINGFEEVIDVVPSLRTDFVRGKNEYHLFKNPKFFKGSTKLKMNPHKQRDLGDFENQKIEVIKLIKILKDREKLSLKSIFITELTKMAFEEIKLPKKPNQILLKVLEYFRDNIRAIQVKSPDNINISLSDSLSFSQKRKIANTLDTILKDLKENKNTLIDYFPEK